MKNQIFLIFTLLGIFISFAQETTRRDSLQGGLRFERTCYDVLRYDLNIKVDPAKKWIFGANEITFKVIEPTKKIQLDLFDNMIIDGITSKEFDKLESTRDENAVFVHFNKALEKDLSIIRETNNESLKKKLSECTNFISKLNSKIERLEKTNTTLKREITNLKSKKKAI